MEIRIRNKLCRSSKVVLTSSNKSKHMVKTRLDHLSRGSQFQTSRRILSRPMTLQNMTCLMMYSVVLVRHNNQVSFRATSLSKGCLNSCRVQLHMAITWELKTRIKQGKTHSHLVLRPFLNSSSNRWWISQWINSNKTLSCGNKHSNKCRTRWWISFRTCPWVVAITKCNSSQIRISKEATLIKKLTIYLTSLIELL